MLYPDGTVTFLFTDIEGSTRLWETHPEPMRSALARHDDLLRQAVEQNNGVVFKTMGDGIAAAFATAPDALRAALAAQEALLGEPWPSFLPLRARMALHTGAAEWRDGDYYGPPLNRVARLMAAGNGGQILLSDVTQDLCRDTLPPQTVLLPLGEHRFKDLTRPESVFQVSHPALLAPDTFAPLKTLDNPALPNNLPRAMTSFIGREKQIAEVTGFIRSSRLLTLVGAGGTGKTRLALQVAAEVLDPAWFPEGAWLVDLASLTDPALVPQTVAQALGIKEVAGQNITQTLGSFLQSKRLLLLLDNSEHVITVCAQLTASLLRACPHLTILATSREPLGIGGEQVYRVPSLSLPDAKGRDVLTPDSVRQFEAVRLLIDRACLVKPAFSVTSTNAPAVAEICYRLDGIPLAIELAAARVRSLSVEQINDKLDSRFRLLTGGDRAALPRQQTLRALIDWSYDLLSDTEKTLLSRLSVFAGGWTIEAAETVCGFDPLQDWEVLDLLTSLCDKSLVMAEDKADGATRYGLLETVRQYGKERLAESGEAATLQARHGDWCLTLTEEAEGFLRGPEQKAWLERLEAEHDNLRAALGRGSPADSLRSLRLAGALGQFWYKRGYLSEGREQLARALQQAPPPLLDDDRAKAARAEVLKGIGLLASAQGDFAVARNHLEQALPLYREVGSKGGVASTLNRLGMIASTQGDFTLARKHLEQSLTLYQELDGKGGIAGTLNLLGLIALRQGDYDQAQVQFEQSLTVSREGGDSQDIASALGNLGVVATLQENYGRARARLEESLHLLRELDDKSNISNALLSLGVIAANQGEQGLAHEYLEQSLTVYRTLGDKRGIAGALHYLGDVAAAQGEYARSRDYQEQSLTQFQEIGDRSGIAACLEGIAFAAWTAGSGEASRARAVVVLLGAAAALRNQIGEPPSAAEQAQRDDILAQARGGLGEAVWTSAWEEGHALHGEEAVAVALSL